MSADCPVCRELGKPDGSCSPWCRDVVEMKAERDALQAEVERLMEIVGNPDTYETLLFENQELRVEIERLRRGIEAYREERTVPKRVVTEQRFRQRLAGATDAVMAWEREVTSGDS